MRDDLLGELRRLHSSGAILSKKHVPQLLYGRCLRAFGSWRTALEAAGLDPDASLARAFEARADAKTTITPETVVAQLQGRLALGKAVHYTAVRSDDLALSQRCTRVFGTFDAALVAAGVDPIEVRRQESWTKPRVIAEIQENIALGWDMNSCAIGRRAPKLLTAAHRLFGGWDQALKAAGADPSVIRRNRDTEADRGDLFDHHCCTLFSAIRPTWQLNNRVQIGERFFEPDIVMPSDAGARFWGDFKVYSWGMSAYKTLQKYSAHVDELKFIYLLGDVRPPAGKAHFESIRTYEEEARSTGLGGIFDRILELEHLDVRELSTSAMALIWTREHCIDTIRSLPAGDRNVNSSRKHGRGLISAVARYWNGVWDDFLVAAGLDPEVERRQGPPVSKEDTARWLRECHAAGHEMSSAGLMKLPRGNTYSAMLSRYFDGLERACAELDLPYTPRRRPSRPVRP